MNLNQPLIEANRIGCCFSRPAGRFRRQPFWALEDVSFDLRRGESLAIIGRNGAGKSTLLQLLAGILRPDRGRLVSRARNATLLSLNAGLEPGLSGRANAIMSGMLLGMKRSDVRARLDAIHELSGLGDFFDMPVQLYSSGMRARLGFSTAYQLDPELMLVDEVLGVGDTAFKAKSTRLMKDRLKSDRTVVLVSHNPSTVRELCDRALWIENGHVEGFGDAEEISAQYEARAVSE
ncbi:MAG: ABC transporter ATP-binding protein [Pseudomonadota bacterium]